MKNRFTLLITIFCAITSVDTFGQAKKDTSTITNKTVTLAAANQTAFDAKYLPKITPKSPNVAAMERYGQYPVSLYTGIPNIEIPLFSFEVGELEIPIKLSYHASGLKVNDNASWVGMGWSLSTGGAISRSVKGAADEGSNGGVLGQELGVVVYGDFRDYLLNYNFNFTSTSLPNCLTDNRKLFLNQITQFNNDAERDIFSYNLPTGSNQFVIAPNTIDGCIWQKSERSKFSYSPGLTNLTITNEEGYKFIFNDTENTTSALDGSSNISAWHLNNIQGTDPTESAIYTYIPNTVNIQIDEVVDTENFRTKIFPTGYKPAGFTSSSTSESSSSLVSSKLVSRIVFPEGKVEFTTIARTDGPAGVAAYGLALNEMQVFSFNVTNQTYTLVKKFKFNYTYKARNGGGTVLFLDNLKLLSADNLDLGTYSMLYNADPLPYTTSRSKDLWGYCNSTNATANCTLIPIISFQDQNFESSPLMTTYNVGTYGQPSGGTCSAPGNRDPNETTMKSWILTQLNFPTGGFSTFDYEAHRYLDGAVQKLAGGLRIKQIVSNDGNGKTVTKSYKYGVGESGNGTFRGQSFEKWYQISQKTRHIFDAFSVLPSEPDHNFTTTTFSSAFVLPSTPGESSPVTYNVVTEYEDAGTALNGKTVYSYLDNSFDNVVKIPQSSKQAQINMDWKRGHLLEKTVRGNDGKLKQRILNTYTAISEYQSPILGYLIGPSLIATGASSNDVNCNNVGVPEYYPLLNYKWNCGVMKLTKSEEYNYDNVDDTKFTVVTSEKSYESNYFKVRDEFQEFSVGGNVRGKTYYYPFDYNIGALNVSGDMLGIKQLQTRNMISDPVEEVTYFKPTKTGALNITESVLSTFTSYDLSGSNVYVKPKVVHLLQSQSPTYFTTFGAFTPSSAVYNLSPSSYLNVVPKHSKYESKITFNSYDTIGNLGSYSIDNGRIDAYTYLSYLHGGVRLSLVQTQTQDSGGLNHVSTYSYSLPLLGISSLTSPNGVLNTFEYDNFGRLKTVKDALSKITKSYQYKYKNGIN